MTRRPPTDRAGKKWKKFRDAYKARCQAAQLPCWRCGRTIDYHAPANHEAAFEADHAVSVAVAPWLMWSESNLRPSCCRCNRKANTAKPPPQPPAPLRSTRWVKPGGQPADSELLTGLRFWATRRARGLITPGEVAAEAQAKAEAARRGLQ